MQQGQAKALLTLYKYRRQVLRQADTLRRAGGVIYYGKFYTAPPVKQGQVSGFYFSAGRFFKALQKAESYTAKASFACMTAVSHRPPFAGNRG